jgi:hypothetical protein
MLHSMMLMMEMMARWQDQLGFVAAPPLFCPFCGRRRDTPSMMLVIARGSPSEEAEYMFCTPEPIPIPHHQDAFQILRL